MGTALEKERSSQDSSCLFFGAYVLSINGEIQSTEIGCNILGGSDIVY